jgi:hypothetical protein
VIAENKTKFNDKKNFDYETHAIEDLIIGNDMDLDQNDFQMDERGSREKRAVSKLKLKSTPVGDNSRPVGDKWR